MAEAMELKRETTGESLIGSLMKFMGSAVGAKIVMALTGAGIWLFTVGHLAGNLLAFAGRNAFNTYAAGLADAPYIVWPTRIALLVGIPLHVFTAIRTVQMNRAARPEGYAYQEKTPARLAAKSMMLTGAVVLAFFLYHLAHFTFRVTGPQPTALLADGHHDAYSMLVMGFQQPLIALFYVVGQVLLAAHLSHGLYSMFQHLGLWGAKWTPFLKTAALAIGYGMCTAFASIPLAVMLGFIKP